MMSAAQSEAGAVACAVHSKSTGMMESPGLGSGVTFPQLIVQFGVPTFASHSQLLTLQLSLFISLWLELHSQNPARDFSARAQGHKTAFS